MMRISKKALASRKQDQVQDLLALFQEVTPDLCHIEAPYRLFRYDKGADRFYYRVAESGAALLPYLSVTSFTGRSLPTSKYLVQWVGNLGNDAAEEKKNMAATYGTIMHIEIGKAIKDGHYDFKDLEDRLLEELPIQYKYQYANWLMELKKDLMSFFQFHKEHNVEVTALEIPVYNDQYGLAGTIDLVCTMDFNGQRVNALVDFKSGRKGFFEGHELQLISYKHMWNELFGSVFPVTHVFNFAPNAWRKRPTFKLKNQTDSIYARTVTQRMAIAKAEGWVTPPAGYLDIHGDVNLANFNAEQHMLRDTSLREAVNQ